METHGSQNFLDFVQRLATKVRCAQHFCFCLLNKIADIDDVIILQAVCRAYGKFEFVDLLEQSRIERKFSDLFLLYFLLRLVKVDEDRQLVLQDACCIGNGIFAGDRTIGLDGKDQLVIIENLSLAGVFDLVRYFANR